MKRNKYKFMSITLLGLVLGTIGLSGVYSSVVLADSNNTVAVKQDLTEQEIALVDKFVSIQGDKFVLNENNNLSEEVELLAKQKIADTNAKVEQTKVTEVVFVNQENKAIYSNGLLLRARGKNAVEFHWNYARIYIDANNVSLALQGGFAIGSVYAPAKAVQAACALLGIGASQIKHGIWFDYNYFTGVVGQKYGFQ